MVKKNYKTGNVRIT